MKFEEIPPQMRECLAIFHAYRCLGYKADDIFFVHNKAAIFMQLKYDDKSFTCVAGPRPEVSDEELFKLWEGAGNAWNGSLNDEQRDDIWQNSFIRKNSVGFLVAMKNKGFLPLPGAKELN